ncbi:MAG: beta-ketoacyl-ACP reductase [Candidatus Puniceispirillum sp.]|nr:beta-ketoacyl-ACP reductase [Candidatus Pelagibacter sp.]MBA4282766.1 beta-ketoacyl-ACP reductase [Candidatus Puniceispirillum sp.]
MKVALVTGGTRGIGAGISKELKEKGYHVIASYVSNVESAQKFEQDTGVQTIQFDVSNFEECETAYKKIIAELGKIDVLIHNAGVTADSTLSRMSQDQWHKVINTNLNSAFYLTQLVLEKMISQKYGRLIYISSVNALKGQRGQANYAATKSALIGFSKSIALEVASKGITSNVVAPGYIDTDMVRAVPEKILEKIIGTIPVGRLGTVDEIAHIVSFLADEKSSFITGSVISANGGMY